MKIHLLLWPHRQLYSILTENKLRTVSYMYPWYLTQNWRLSHIHVHLSKRNTVHFSILTITTIRSFLNHSAHHTWADDLQFKKIFLIELFLSYFISRPKVDTGQPYHLCQFFLISLQAKNPHSQVVPSRVHLFNSISIEGSTSSPPSVVC